MEFFIEFAIEIKAFFISAISGVLFYLASYYKCKEDPNCEAKFYVGLMITKLFASGFIGYIVEPMLNSDSNMYGFWLACIGAGSFKILELMGDKAETLLKGK